MLSLTILADEAREVLIVPDEPPNGGPPIESPPPRQDEGLTRREKEILRLTACGHSNAQMGRLLWITEQTVKFHLSNVFRKLQVSNRTQASRWAQDNGLLNDESEDS